jgi:hypothetical protein
MSNISSTQLNSNSNSFTHSSSSSPFTKWRGLQTDKRFMELHQIEPSRIAPQPAAAASSPSINPEHRSPLSSELRPDSKILDEAMKTVSVTSTEFTGLASYEMTKNLHPRPKRDAPPNKFEMTPDRSPNPSPHG